VGCWVHSGHNGSQHRLACCCGLRLPDIRLPPHTWQGKRRQ